jgi:hypothetical protein
MDNTYYHYTLVKKGSYTGLLNKHGTEVLPCEYDRVELSSDETKITAWKNNRPTGYHETDAKLVPASR